MKFEDLKVGEYYLLDNGYHKFLIFIKSIRKHDFLTSYVRLTDKQYVNIYRIAKDDDIIPQFHALTDEELQKVKLEYL